jgi:hypothetical protein
MAPMRPTPAVEAQLPVRVLQTRLRLAARLEPQTVLGVIAHWLKQADEKPRAGEQV